MGRKNTGSEMNNCIGKIYRVYNYLKANDCVWVTRKDILENTTISNYETINYILNFLIKMNLVEEQKTKKYILVYCIK